MLAHWMGSHMSVCPSDGGQELYIKGCPIWHIVASPATCEVFRAHRWWETGQLALLYPHGVPVALVRALDAVTNGRARGERERWEDAERRRKAR
jgi:hypothetical protein